MKKNIYFLLFFVVVIFLIVGVSINNESRNNEIRDKLQEEWKKYSDAYKDTNDLILKLTKKDHKAQEQIKGKIGRYSHTFDYKNDQIVGLSRFEYSFTNKNIADFNKMNEFFKKRKSVIDFILVEKDRVAYGLDGSPMIVYSRDKIPDRYFGGDHDLEFSVVKLEKDWYVLFGNVPR